MFYILVFQVDKHELYRPPQVPRRGRFVKALVASVRIVAYKLGQKSKNHPIKKLLIFICINVKSRKYCKI